MNLATLTDDQLKSFIVQVFQRYDANGDGTL